MKPVRFLGDALEQLRAFPETARRAAGFQIDRVQNGLEPNDWKPMSTIGPGVREIRLRERSGAYRVIYMASWEETVVVIHAFQKKTEQTAQTDIALAVRRLKTLRSA